MNAKPPQQRRIWRRPEATKAEQQMNAKQKTQKHKTKQTNTKQ